MTPPEAKAKRKTKTAAAPRRARKSPTTTPAAIRIKLRRSLIGSSPYQRAVVSGLGLRRVNQVVERRDTPEIRGMVAKVPHLVEVVPG